MWSGWKEWWRDYFILIGMTIGAAIVIGFLIALVAKVFS